VEQAPPLPDGALKRANKERGVLVVRSVTGWGASGCAPTMTKRSRVTITAADVGAVRRRLGIVVVFILRLLLGGVVVFAALNLVVGGVWEDAD